MARCGTTNQVWPDNPPGDVLTAHRCRDEQPWGVGSAGVGMAVRVHAGVHERNFPSRRRTGASLV